ncbi:inositol polyphosphate kinase, putative (IPK2) [Plasmodium ovale curtisi]|nr:inositol polyphosphate kinase, putative (IPK2) [Plasmodium ovale curtisi]
MGKNKRDDYSIGHYFRDNYPLHVENKRDLVYSEILPFDREREEAHTSTLPVEDSISHWEERHRRVKKSTEKGHFNESIFPMGVCNSCENGIHGDKVKYDGQNKIIGEQPSEVKREHAQGNFSEYEHVNYFQNEKNGTNTLFRNLSENNGEIPYLVIREDEQVVAHTSQTSISQREEKDHQSFILSTMDSNPHTVDGNPCTADRNPRNVSDAYKYELFTSNETNCRKTHQNLSYNRWIKCTENDLSKSQLDESSSEVNFAIQTKGRRGDQSEQGQVQKNDPFMQDINDEGVNCESAGSKKRGKDHVFLKNSFNGEEDMNISSLGIVNEKDEGEKEEMKDMHNRHLSQNSLDTSKLYNKIKKPKLKRNMPNRIISCVENEHDYMYNQVTLKKLSYGSDSILVYNKAIEQSAGITKLKRRTRAAPARCSTSALTLPSAEGRGTKKKGQLKAKNEGRPSDERRDRRRDKHRDKYSEKKARKERMEKVNKLKNEKRGIIGGSPKKHFNRPFLPMIDAIRGDEFLNGIWGRKPSNEFNIFSLEFKNSSAFIDDVTKENKTKLILTDEMVHNNLTRKNLIIPLTETNEHYKYLRRSFSEPNFYNFSRVRCTHNNAFYDTKINYSQLINNRIDKMMRVPIYNEIYGFTANTSDTDSSALSPIH